MAEKSIQIWIETAVNQMKFPPDRDRVRQELWDHLLDSRDYRMEQGMDLKEAEDAAVIAMGDPVATGKMLNKVHRPWLGWVWTASRLLLLAVCLYCFCTVCMDNRFELWNYRFFRGDWGCGQVCAYTPNTKSDPPLIVETTPITPGAVEQAGVYTLTLDHGNWLTAENIQYVILCFRVRSERLLDLAPYGFDSRLRAEDDQGNQYDWQVGGNPYHVSGCEVRPPYIHLMLNITDSKPRKWVRFYVPDTEFDITISAEGRALPWPKQED